MIYREECRVLISLARELLLEDLLPDFRRSLDVPQFGPYHNEGPFMDSHLKLVLEALEETEADNIPETVPRVIQNLMREGLEFVGREAARLYVLLHDLSKADCLTIIFVGRAGNKIRVPVSWERWLWLLQKWGPDGKRTLAGDGDALARICRSKGVQQISYYQEGKGSHAKVAAKMLDRREDILPIVVRATGLHELAFGAFRTVNTNLAAKTFAHMPYSEIGFHLLVNWADQTGSLGRDGRPDISGFLNMAKSYLAWLEES